MLFYIGTHCIQHSGRLPRVFISVNQLWTRKSGFEIGDWIMDSGSFSEISKHGRYTHTVEDYYNRIEFFSNVGNLQAAVCQDYMCEPFIIKKTGLSVPIHQKMTVDRYDELLSLHPSVYIMPVLQGFHPQEYVNHLELYGDRVLPDMYVGVGSVCKRNTNVRSIISVLSAIKNMRPDIKLHGFGLKFTALCDPGIRYLLHSSDSMAWSFGARMSGRDANSVYEALDYYDKVEKIVALPKVSPTPPIWLGHRFGLQ